MARYVVPHFRGAVELRQASWNHAWRNHENFAGAAAAAIQSETEKYQARKKG